MLHQNFRFTGEYTYCTRNLITDILKDISLVYKNNNIEHEFQSVSYSHNEYLSLTCVNKLKMDVSIQNIRFVVIDLRYLYHNMSVVSFMGKYHLYHVNIDAVNDTIVMNLKFIKNPAGHLLYLHLLPDEITSMIAKQLYELYKCCDLKEGVIYMMIADYAAAIDGYKY